mgnify:FL=1
MGKEIDLNLGKQDPTQLKIKASDLKDIICEECGGKFFRSVQMFKRLSALISPTGKEQIAPIPIFRCDDCGHINAEFLPASD